MAEPNTVMNFTDAVAQDLAHWESLTNPKTYRPIQSMTQDHAVNSKSSKRAGVETTLEVPPPYKKIKRICCLGAGYVVSKALIATTPT